MDQAASQASCLNQSHGEICMRGLLQDGIDRRGEEVSQGLEDAPAPPLDFVGPVGDVPEELADVLVDLGLSPEARGGSDLFSDPAPDGFIRVEVWAVGGKTNQAQVQVGGGQGGADGVAPVCRTGVPDHDHGLGVVGAIAGGR